MMWRPVLRDSVTALTFNIRYQGSAPLNVDSAAALMGDTSSASRAME